MPPAYRFLDRWAVEAPIERVYDTIGDVLASNQRVDAGGEGRHDGRDARPAGDSRSPSAGFP